MKNPNFLFAPTVISFGSNILKERIIAIMNFKKPTALTTALSALLVLGVGTTAAFAVTPQTPDTEKPEISISAPEISEPEFTASASESVPEIDETDIGSKNSEPEPEAPETEPASENPTNDDEIWSEPDSNGFSYSKLGDAIRIPVMDVSSRPKTLDGSIFSFKKILTEERVERILAVRLDNLPDGYKHGIYFGNEYAIIEKCDCDSAEPENYTYEEIFDDGIIRG